jgi:hypothetical protein
MTELEWLKQESGLTDDELKTYESILGDGKFKAMLKKVISANETLAQAKAQAEAERTTAQGELEQFATRYNSEFVPAMREVTQQAVAKEGELAALRAKLAKAKEFGLVIDDESVTSAPSASAAPPRAPGSPDPNVLTREDLNRFSNAQSETLIALQNLNAEHFDLFGKPLSGTDEIVSEVQRQRMIGNKNYTLRSAWEAKYNVAAKRKEMQAEAQSKHDEEIREATRREMMERHGSNPHMRSGQMSRYDKYKTSDAAQDGRKPWQGPRGARERNMSWREDAINAVRTARVA